MWAQYSKSKRKKEGRQVQLGVNQNTLGVALLCQRGHVKMAQQSGCGETLCLKSAGQRGMLPGLRLASTHSACSPSVSVKVILQFRGSETLDSGAEVSEDVSGHFSLFGPSSLFL